MACFTLPPHLFGFYKNHIDFITAHAVDPDRRRYADPEEAPRHFINLDHYVASSLDSVPKYWNDAVKKYSLDTLKVYGIVPWHISIMTARLTNAFKNHDVDRILYLSASLGHYIADAHVPLHCAENYNGQKTNQIGIHAFWESRIPELFGEDFDYFTGRVHYIAKQQLEAWKIVEQSFAAHDSVLSFEMDLNKRFPPDQKFAYEQRGNVTMKVYSEAYSKEYNNMLDEMVQRRMRSAIIETGSFWYTAWVNAGSPDMKLIEDKEASDSLKAKLKEEEAAWEKGTLKPKGHDENGPK
jgi:hypothetical protein